jgi:hypothetical protein
VWSANTVGLATNLQTDLRRDHALDKLGFLLHPSNLTDRDAAQLLVHAEGIVWPRKDVAKRGALD